MNPQYILEIYLRMIPQEIEHQVRQVASYYADKLPQSGQDELPEVPEWLSTEAQSWIRSHYFEFSDLVVAARKAS